MGSLRSFKKLKGKSLAKTSEVKFKYGGEEYALPLKSIGVLEEAEVIDFGIKPPKVERKATKEEQEEYMKENPETIKGLLRELKIVEFDYSDEEYLEKLRKASNLKSLSDVCRYVDLKAKVGKEQLWENLGLNNDKDYIGLVNLLFVEWELDNSFLQRLTVAIKTLSNDPVWVELQKLEGAFGDKSWFELLPLLLSALEKENAKA